jgi:hypothetical protein
MITPCPATTNQAIALGQNGVRISRAFGMLDHRTILLDQRRAGIVAHHFPTCSFRAGFGSQLESHPGSDVGSGQKRS